ncbi:hypothetical protein [Tritonibacter mobilis]|uniref:hypothetical protein n=1 Tax=Tritonibacter mobilis TaxID=379347 RepID=UPI000806CC70|nr:hypothetical protein [Tritonibacter mobilis]
MNAPVKKNTFKYVPDGKVITEFFWDRSPVSIIQGPVGSGTSTACCHKMWKISLEQEPDATGVRRTRWLIVRNTYNELEETTIKTWTYWFEEKAQGLFGGIKMTKPPNHHIRWDAPDGTIVDAEFIFLALDKDEDVRKLLSLECTGIWFNEAQFTEKVIFDAAHGRAMQGRYPPKLDGGPTWKGVICDLNAPPEGHWIPYMRGDIPFPDDWDDDMRREYTPPDDWNFYLQPAGLIELIKDKKVVGYIENTRENRIIKGLNPDGAAENTKWLTERYERLIQGKSKDYINTYVMNRIGLYKAGKAVYETFSQEAHIAKERLQPIPNLPLIVGLDFARNPAMVVIQVLRGAVRVLFEYGVVNQAATTYAPLFKTKLLQNFPEFFAPGGAGAKFWGDPSGDSKGQGTDKTPFQIFKTNGMNVIAAPGNNSISLRINAVQSALDKMVEGGPGFSLDSRCRVLKGGFLGGYHYAKIQGTNAYHEEPNKRVTFADYHDALQYACLGAGLGVQVLTGSDKPPQPQRMPKKSYSMKRGRRGSRR